MAWRTNSQKGMKSRKTILPLESSGPAREIRDSGVKVLGRVISEKRPKNKATQMVLKAAWERFRSVSITEVDEYTLSFDFLRDRDRE